MLAGAVLLLCTACASQTTVVPAGSASTPATATAPASASVGAKGAAGSSVSASAVASPGGGDQQQLDADADAINRLGNSFPDVFTGLAVDVPHGHVVVYRKAGSSAFDSALARLGLGPHVVLHDAPRAIGELRDTRRRVVALIGRTSGYTIMSVGDGSVTSFANGVVEVGVNGNLARAKADLRARFGDAVSVTVAPPLGG